MDDRELREVRDAVEAIARPLTLFSLAILYAGREQVAPVLPLYKGGTGRPPKRRRGVTDADRAGSR